MQPINTIGASENNLKTKKAHLVFVQWRRPLIYTFHLVLILVVGFPYCAKNGKGLKIGTKEADTI